MDGQINIREHLSQEIVQRYKDRQVKKNYVVITGPDGCGKSTQIKLLEKLITKDIYDKATVFRVPERNNASGNILRDYIDLGEGKYDRETLDQLFYNDALHNGKKVELINQLVIQDRSLFDSFCYRCGHSSHVGVYFKSFLDLPVWPELMIILAVKPSTAYKRLNKIDSKVFNEAKLEDINKKYASLKDFLNTNSNIKTVMIDTDDKPIDEITEILIQQIIAQHALPVDGGDDWDLGERTCSIDPEECESCT